MVLWGNLKAPSHCQRIQMACAPWELAAPSRPEPQVWFLWCWANVQCCSPLGPDIVCRWWASAITMAISWLQGDDLAVRTHFTEVEHVPKALEVTECVSLLDHFLVSLGES